MVYGPTLDLDNDGLTLVQETLQNTSDDAQDTDGDGLRDDVESQWYQDRDDIFCNTDASPYECAYPDPINKDLYVQIDWIKDSSNRTYKPSSTQLSLVEGMFDDKGINFHADTGQFGGGEQLATSTTEPLRRTPTAGSIDYWDYKDGGDGITAKFSSDRSSIWRYMIYGHTFLEHPTFSGWAETMGDDIFISGGLIEDTTGLASEDRAIANTMAHEIGHNICLSDEKVWTEQPIECVYDGMDNDDSGDTDYNLENYKSVMNYLYQLTDQDDMNVVNYSDGSHGAGDHDDWGGVMMGMGGFSGMHTSLGAEVAYFRTPDGGMVRDEASTDEIMKNNREQAEAEDRDDPIAEDSSQPDAEGTDKQPVANKNSSSDLIPVFIGGGAGLLLAAAGATWYIKGKRKK